MRRLAGLVNRPVALMLPAVADHVTPVLGAFATIAVNCCGWPETTAAVAGVTVTVIAGDNVTVAVPVVVLSAWLVAVIVTDCSTGMLAGAVYRPVELIVPAVAAHVTAVLAEFSTVVANCCVWLPNSVAAGGVTVTM